MNRIAVVVALLLPVFSFAQSDDLMPCGNDQKTHELMMKYPMLSKNIREAEEQLERETEANLNKRGGGENELYIIPVVFHVIHNGGNENISDEQIYSALEGLNRDFRLLNEDIENVPDEFLDIAADVEVEFRLAQRDPEGNCSKGIVRVQSTLTYDGLNDALKELSNWPRDMYLNVWVVDVISGNTVAYSYLPSTVNGPWMADEDGIVIRSDYTGLIGTSNNQRSRTLVHECGHWLNLRHTWGSGNSPGDAENCDQDDGVEDTPLCIGTQGGCNLLNESCGSLDNTNNHMEYTSCRFMYTEGQKTRMRTALESTVAERNQLWQEGNLEATGVFEDTNIVCEAVFYTERNDYCSGDSIQFSDDSYHGITSWSWDFGDGTVLEGTDPELFQNPTHVYDEPGTYTVTLTVSDGVDTVSETKVNFLQVYASDYLNNALVEGFESGINQDKWDEYNLDNDDVTWEETSVASYEGASCLRLRNRFVTIYDATDELISATFDMSEESNIIINYKWAFALKSEHTDDRFKVSTSNNCGKTWTLREVHRGQTDLPSAPDHNSNFVPDGDSEWKQETIFIDDPDQLTSNFRVKFEFNGRGGNNFYLDAINIGNENVLSVDDFGLDQFVNIYPNPSDDVVNIVFEKIRGEQIIIELYDLTGRRVLNMQSSIGDQQNSFEINKGSLSSGAYVLSIREGNNALNKKILFE